MPFVDTHQIAPFEKRPGWRGRIFHTTGMTFGHWEFEAGAEIHAHEHPQEEVWQVLEGELEITVGEVTRTVTPGIVGVVPPNTVHRVVARTAGRAIAIDNPRRPDFGPS
jgi:quercetin dioxygenase-like cupin family protein